MTGITIFNKLTDEIITVCEGTGDNLLPEDTAEGYVDYFMATIYTRDKYELKEVDGAQIMTKKLIQDMDEEEQIETLGSYFGFGPYDAIVLES